MVQIFYENSDADAELFFRPGASYRVLPSLTAMLSFEMRSTDYFDENRTIKFKPGIEYTLKGPAVFYAEYELQLTKYKSGSHHLLSIGLDIKAF
jgi:hypothetical protein